MANAANNDELITALETHQQETEHQIKRLDQIFNLLDKNSQGKKCEGIEGIVKEAEEMISDFKDSPALDAAIIAAAQKAEHYEIASYGTLKTYAAQLALDDVVVLLDEILQEEKAADEKLTEIAEGAVNIEAEEEAVR
jgi:ferritin-like metal-binding protein YciE